MSDDARTSMPAFATRAIRVASRAPQVDQEPTAVPIYQTATFRAADTSELADVLGDRRPGYAYSRIDNPTADALAAAVAELEGAEAGLAFGSGMAAVAATLLAFLGAGDHVVAARALYGSTQTLLTGQLARLGVGTTFVDPTDHAAVRAAFTDRTRLLYVETISNPTIVVADLDAFVAIARQRGVPLVVDNTFASPYLCRPVELGADLVIESATKWLGGHSDVLAGVVCGPDQRIADVRRVSVETGGIVSPFSAFLVLRGIETLALRMERHSANALALAGLLEADPAVRRVYYPGLASHPQAEVARRQLRLGGGMLAFDLGTREAGAVFLDALRVPERTASLGSVHTIAVHPPSTTHRQLSSDDLDRAGIAPGLVRLSVGLEDVDDLAADIAGGLRAVRTAAVA